MTHDTILKAFWSRSRKSFVPLSQNDLKYRAGLATHRTAYEVRPLVNQGLLTVSKSRSEGEEIMICRLTEAGENVVMGMVK